MKGRLPLPNPLINYLRFPQSWREKGPAAQKCFFISPRPQGGTKASSRSLASLVPRSARSRSLAELFLKKGVSPFCKGSARMCTPGCCVWQLTEIQRQICSPKGGASSLQRVFRSPGPDPLQLPGSNSDPLQLPGSNSDPLEKWTSLADVNRRNKRVRVQKCFCKLIDMLGKLQVC